MFSQRRGRNFPQ
jgi:hypothetical protein